MIFLPISAKSDIFATENGIKTCRYLSFQHRFHSYAVAVPFQRHPPLRDHHPDGRRVSDDLNFNGYYKFDFTLNRLKEKFK